jgi:hypothetical protein
MSKNCPTLKLLGSVIWFNRAISSYDTEYRLAIFARVSLDCTIYSSGSCLNVGTIRGASGVGVNIGWSGLRVGGKNQGMVGVGVTRHPPEISTPAGQGVLIISKLDGFQGVAAGACLEQARMVIPSAINPQINFLVSKLNS